MKTRRTIILTLVVMMILCLGSSIIVSAKNATGQLKDDMPQRSANSGSSTPETRFIQIFLNKWDSNLDLTEDGYFGPKTASAVKTFQTKYSLNSDGIVGPNTWNKIQSRFYLLSKTGNSSMYHHNYAVVNKSGTKTTPRIATFNDSKYPAESTWSIWWHVGNKEYSDLISV